jgi:hypothetical protein
LTVLLAVLALASPVFATEYFVSPTGNNSSACTAASSACATINGAIAKATADSNACGDTVTIGAGTYSGSVDIPNANCSTSRFIVRGDPAAAASSIVVAGTVTVGTAVNAARKGYTIQHMKFAAPALPMFDLNCAGTSTNEVRDVVLDDIVITSIPNASHSADGSPKYALGLHKGGSCSTAGGPFVFKNMKISNGGVKARVNLFNGFWNWTLQDSTIADQSGHLYFGSSRPGIVITRNTFSNALCTCVVDPCSGDAEADGDGCIIGYNNIMSITYNVFDGVSGNDENDSVNSVVNARRTTSSTTPATDITLNHNTFIAATPTSNTHDIGFESNSIMNATVTNNIFLGYGGSGSTYGAPITWAGSTAGGGGCPVGTKTEKNNLFYQSFNNLDIKDNGGSCGGNNGYGTGDIRSSSNLNPFAGCATPATCPGGPYIPPGGSAACSSATDGTAIGAKDCGATSSSPPPNVTNVRRTDDH